MQLIMEHRCKQIKAWMDVQVHATWESFEKLVSWDLCKVAENFMLLFSTNITVLNCFTLQTWILSYSQATFSRCQGDLCINNTQFIACLSMWL